MKNELEQSTDEKRGNLSKVTDWILQKLLPGILGGFITSFVMLLLAYYYFDQQSQAFRNRARLQVSVESVPNWEKPIKNDEGHLYFKAKINNIGELPARDVQIVSEYGYSGPFGWSPPDPHVTFDPPVDYEISQKDDTFVITLKRPIPPHRSVMFITTESPGDVWVYNEFGELSSIRTLWSLRKKLPTSDPKDCPVTPVSPGQAGDSR